MPIKRRKVSSSQRDYTEKVRSSLSKPRYTNSKVDFIGSGCTHLNLCLSGRHDVGYARGRITNIVGDGSSGKTVMALEAAFWFYNYIKKRRSHIFPKVRKIIIVYDNGEGVMDFDIEKMYGSKFEKKVKWIRSPHFEAMCRNYIRYALNLDKGVALLYIIDSWDSFKSFKSKQAFLKSVETDKEEKGDYDTAVQKYASSKFFPNVVDVMENNKVDATLMIISQVRAKIGVVFGRKQQRTGGKALDFYTHLVAWVREVEKKAKTKYGDKRVYAIRSEVSVDRSKVAMPFRQGQFRILYNYGFDDINSMLDYLFGVKARSVIWKGKKVSRENAVKMIECNGEKTKKAIKQREKNVLLLQHKMQKKWDKVENAFQEEVDARAPRI